MAKEKDSIIIYESFFEATEDLPDSEKLEIYHAYYAYIKGKEPILTTPSTRQAWKFIVLQLNADGKKWSESKAKRSNAGKQGMLSRWHSGKITNNNNDNNVISDNIDNNDNKHNCNVTVTVIKENILKENKVVKEVISENTEESPQEDKPKVKKFVPPTVDEVKAYAAKMGYAGFNAVKFHAHYESNGWKVSKNKMKDWKAAVRYWANNDYGNGGNYGNAKCTSSRNEGTFNELSNGYEKFDE